MIISSELHTKRTIWMSVSVSLGALLLLLLLILSHAGRDQSKCVSSCQQAKYDHGYLKDSACICTTDTVVIHRR